MTNMKIKTKTEIKAMKFKCPFCGETMIYIEDDLADSVSHDGVVHTVRDLVFGHERDYVEGKPWLYSDCQGGSINYYFIESKDNSELQDIEKTF